MKYDSLSGLLKQDLSKCQCIGLIDNIESTIQALNEPCDEKNYESFYNDLGTFIDKIENYGLADDCMNNMEKYIENGIKKNLLRKKTKSMYYLITGSFVASSLIFQKYLGFAGMLGLGALSGLALFCYGAKKIPLVKKELEKYYTNFLRMSYSITEYNIINDGNSYFSINNANRIFKEIKKRIDKKEFNYIAERFKTALE